ncbi:hypothetical protein FGG08_006721 [Glutinoglossum americanum]|uniref:Uncharacterized protein n=1 Tax=Glutinoglossum americanum TaxID=1670608 RepID=A0A9P8KUN9_9PEZI|nr:hypothetical protein FGG08_006721 [Glutinoglossum americanum]
MNSTPSSSPGGSPRYSSQFSHLSSSTSSSLLALYPSSCSYVVDRQSCAFPAWPNRSSLRSHEEDESSSYISDADLFFDPVESVSSNPAFAVGCLPSSPDPYAMVRVRDARRAPPKEFLMAAQETHTVKPKKRRRSSTAKKVRRSSDHMSPIVEAPE